MRFIKEICFIFISPVLIWDVACQAEMTIPRLHSNSVPSNSYV